MELIKIEKDFENRVIFVLKVSKILKIGDSLMIWLVFVGFGLIVIGISFY